MNASKAEGAMDPNAAATGEGIFGLDCTPAEARVVLVPVPFDATTSYRPGTADGPAAMLQASHQVDLHDPRTGDPYRSGIAMLPIPATVRRWSREAGPVTSRHRPGIRAPYRVARRYARHPT